MKVVPSLILMKCACHSVPLSMSYAASGCLPRAFIIAENHNCLSNSSIKQKKYCSLYNAINDNSTPFKIPALSQTRWLLIQIEVERIGNQWLELKLHFQMSRQYEKCHCSEIIHAMYNDEKNLAFFSKSYFESRTK